MRPVGTRRRHSEDSFRAPCWANGEPAALSIELVPRARTGFLSRVIVFVALPACHVTQTFAELSRNAVRVDALSHWMRLKPGRPRRTRRLGSVPSCGARVFLSLPISLTSRGAPSRGAPVEAEKRRRVAQMTWSRSSPHPDCPGHPSQTQWLRCAASARFVRLSRWRR